METKRSGSRLERVTVAPGVRSGQPIIRGTRTTVADILGWLATGASEGEILDDLPWLEPDDIKSALAYAATQIRQQAR